MHRGPRAATSARMLEQAIAGLRGDAGFLALRDGSAGFRVASSMNLSKRRLGFIQPLLSGPLPAMAQTRPFEDFSELDGRPVGLLAGDSDGPRYLMLAPLLLEGDLLGLLAVFRADALSHFQAMHRPILEALASQMAASVHQEQVIQQLLADKEQNADSESTYLSIVTHELLTPLSIIKGYASTLARPDVEWRREVVTESLQVIEEEADRLSRLVSDLLEASRIQSRGMHIDRVQVDLRSLFERAAARLRAAHPDTPLQLLVEGEPGAIQADPDRLEQVLVNLVDNAVKYSPAGAAVAIALHGDEDEICFSVSDGGIGLTAAEAQRVFDRFYRADGAAQGRVKGTGLGLFIVRAIVEAHGGRVWVESVPRQGSTFCVALPRQP